jgi:hypothetical protein
MTSELGKPAGLVVLSREDALARFGDGPPGVVPGIGPKTVERLERLGITTLRALGKRDRAELESSFGPRSGAWLHARGQLLDNTPIAVERETKSQSVETTFDVDVTQRGELERTLREQTEELCRRLAKRELEGRSIGIKVRLDDWTNVTRSQSIEAPTDDPEVVWPIALSLLRGYDPKPPARTSRRCDSPSPADALVVGQHRADPREAEPILDRFGQVVIATGDVGTAVDHRDRDRAAVVAELHLGPARQRLVGDAERPRLEGAAAGDAVAVKAGTVVGGTGQAITGQVTLLAPGTLGGAVVDAVGLNREGPGLIGLPVHLEGAVGPGPGDEDAVVGATEHDLDPVAAAGADLASQRHRLAAQDGMPGEVEGDV